MNPLLVAYDSRIHELTRENTVYKDKITEMQQHIKTLITENEELHDKIKKQIRTRMDQTEKGTISAVLDTEFGIDPEDWYV